MQVATIRERWVKDIWELSVLYFQFFCKYKIISSWKIDQMEFLKKERKWKKHQQLLSTFHMTDSRLR